VKIAIWHNLPSGGGKRAAYHQIEGLVKRGHVVEAWSPDSADHAYLSMTHLIREHVLPLEAPSAPQGLLSSLLGPHRAMARRIAAMDRHCESAAGQIASGGFDVLLAHPCALFRVTAIGRYLPIPKVLYVQEPYRDLYEAHPRLPWLALPRTRGRMRVLRRMMPFLSDLARVQALRLQAREECQNAAAFDRLLVNSYFSRESVLRAYGLDASVCYLGVSTDMFRPLGLPRERSIIGLGAIHHLKGVETAIRAIATMPGDRRPPLVWVGNFSDEGYRPKVVGLAQTLGVQFVPHVRISDEELVYALNRATALVYTSHLEPFGLAPLEANACGTPVVAVAEGGVRETIQDGVNGLLVPDHRPQTIGQALQRLLDNAEFAAALGARGQALVAERWTWDAAVDRLEAFLFEAIRPRP
jgi:glycosyltransferase involved in cell wall biosynthesis